MEENHKFINPVHNFDIIKVERNVRERKLKEQLEIMKERETVENTLMNIKVNFDNEEIFYNILSKYKIKK